MTHLFTPVWCGESGTGLARIGCCCTEKDSASWLSFRASLAANLGVRLHLATGLFDRERAFHPGHAMSGD